MKRLLSILAALALPGLAAGQMTQTGLATPAQQHKAQASKPHDARATFESRVRAELDRIEAGIARLEKTTADKGKSVPQALAALRGKADALEAKLSQLKAAGIKEWDGMKADVEKSMKDLSGAYHRFGAKAQAKTPVKPQPPQP